MSTPAAPKVGDLVRVRKGSYRGLIEVDYVDDLIVEGRIPYATTYTDGGKYEGSYRGRQSAWLSQVETIERNLLEGPLRDTATRLTRPSTAFDRPPLNVYTVPDDGGSPMGDISERPSLIAPVEVTETDDQAPPGVGR